MDSMFAEDEFHKHGPQIGKPKDTAFMDCTKDEADAKKRTRCEGNNTKPSQLHLPVDEEDWNSKTSEQSIHAKSSWVSVDNGGIGKRTDGSKIKVNVVEHKSNGSSPPDEGPAKKQRAESKVPDPPSQDSSAGSHVNINESQSKDTEISSGFASPATSVEYNDFDISSGFNDWVKTNNNNTDDGIAPTDSVSQVSMPYRSVIGSNVSSVRDSEVIAAMQRAVETDSVLAGTDVSDLRMHSPPTKIKSHAKFRQLQSETLTILFDKKKAEMLEEKRARKASGQPMPKREGGNNTAKCISDVWSQMMLKQGKKEIQIDIQPGDPATSSKSVRSSSAGEDKGYGKAQETKTEKAPRTPAPYMNERGRSRGPQEKSQRAGPQRWPQNPASIAQQQQQSEKSIEGNKTRIELPIGVREKTNAIMREEHLQLLQQQANQKTEGEERVKQEAQLLQMQNMMNIGDERHQHIMREKQELHEKQILQVVNELEIQKRQHEQFTRTGIEQITKMADEEKIRLQREAECCRQEYTEKARADNERMRQFQAIAEEANAQNLTGGQDQTIVQQQLYALQTQMQDNERRYEIDRAHNKNSLDQATITSDKKIQQHSENAERQLASITQGYHTAKQNLEAEMMTESRRLQSENDKQRRDNEIQYNALRNECLIHVDKIERDQKAKMARAEQQYHADIKTTAETQKAHDEQRMNEILLNERQQAKDCHNREIENMRKAMEDERQRLKNENDRQQQENAFHIEQAKMLVAETNKRELLAKEYASQCNSELAETRRQQEATISSISRSYDEKISKITEQKKYERQSLSPVMERRQLLTTNQDGRALIIGAPIEPPRGGATMFRISSPDSSGQEQNKKWSGREGQEPPPPPPYDSDQGGRNRCTRRCDNQITTPSGGMPLIQCWEQCRHPENHEHLSSFDESLRNHECTGPCGFSINEDGQRQQLNYVRKMPDIHTLAEGYHTARGNGETQCSRKCDAARWNSERRILEYCGNQCCYKDDHIQTDRFRKAHMCGEDHRFVSNTEWNLIKHRNKVEEHEQHPVKHNGGESGGTPDTKYMGPMNHDDFDKMFNEASAIGKTMTTAPKMTIPGIRGLQANSNWDLQSPFLPTHGPNQGGSGPTGSRNNSTEPTKGWVPYHQAGQNAVPRTDYVQTRMQSGTQMPHFDTRRDAGGEEASSSNRTNQNQGTNGGPQGGNGGPQNTTVNGELEYAIKQLINLSIEEKDWRKKEIAHKIDNAIYQNSLVIQMPNIPMPEMYKRIPTTAGKWKGWKRALAQGFAEASGLHNKGFEYVNSIWKSNIGTYATSTQNFEDLKDVTNFEQMDLKLGRLIDGMIDYGSPLYFKMEKLQKQLAQKADGYLMTGRQKVAVVLEAYEGENNMGILIYKTTQDLFKVKLDTAKNEDIEMFMIRWDDVLCELVGGDETIRSNDDLIRKHFFDEISMWRSRIPDDHCKLNRIKDRFFDCTTNFSRKNEIDPDTVNEETGLPIKVVSYPWLECNVKKQIKRRLNWCVNRAAENPDEDRMFDPSRKEQTGKYRTPAMPATQADGPPPGLEQRKPTADDQANEHKDFERTQPVTSPDRQQNAPACPATTTLDGNRLPDNRDPVWEVYCRFQYKGGHCKKGNECDHRHTGLTPRMNDVQAKGREQRNQALAQRDQKPYGNRGRNEWNNDWNNSSQDNRYHNNDDKYQRGRQYERDEGNQKGQNYERGPNYHQGEPPQQRNEQAPRTWSPPSHMHGGTPEGSRWIPKGPEHERTYARITPRQTTEISPRGYRYPLDKDGQRKVEVYSGDKNELREKYNYIRSRPETYPRRSESGNRIPTPERTPKGGGKGHQPQQNADYRDQDKQQRRSDSGGRRQRDRDLAGIAGARACYDFAENKCRRGDDCKFSHDPETIKQHRRQNAEQKRETTPPSRQGDKLKQYNAYHNADICQKFARTGHCDFGNKCWYRHATERKMYSSREPNGKEISGESYRELYDRDRSPSVGSRAPYRDVVKPWKTHSRSPNPR